MVHSVKFRLVPGPGESRGNKMLLTEEQAEYLVTEMCKACPLCSKPMVRESRLKCYCRSCGVHCELVPGAAS